MRMEADQERCADDDRSARFAQTAKGPGCGKGIRHMLEDLLAYNDIELPGRSSGADIEVGVFVGLVVSPPAASVKSPADLDRGEPTGLQARYAGINCLRHDDTTPLTGGGRRHPLAELLRSEDN